MMIRVCSRIAVCVMLSAAPASALLAQTLGARVVDRATRHPMRKLAVHLLTDSAVVARATTDSSGVFYVEAPAEGLYRLRFIIDADSDYVTDTLRLAGDFVEREFLIDIPKERTYSEFEVEQQVAPRPGTRAPEYPIELRQQNIEGSVRVQFVVDPEGRPEMETFRVLSSTHPDFTFAVRRAVPSMRFFPAVVRGVKVRQLVRMPFEFHLSREH